jgi:hypothetical protein
MYLANWWNDISAHVHLDALTIFGFISVVAALVFYSKEESGPAYTLAFGIACFASSIYGFLQGAWPFGVIEAVWGIVATRKWVQRVAARSAMDASKTSDTAQ